MRTNLSTLKRISFLLNIRRTRTTSLLRMILSQINNYTNHGRAALQVTQESSIFFLVVHIKSRMNALFLKLLKYHKLNFFLILILIIFRVIIINIIFIGIIGVLIRVIGIRVIIISLNVIVGPIVSLDILIFSRFVILNLLHNFLHNKLTHNLFQKLYKLKLLNKDLTYNNHETNLLLNLLTKLNYLLNYHHFLHNRGYSF